MKKRVMAGFLIATLCLSAPALALKRSRSQTPAPTPIAVSGYGRIIAEESALRLTPDEDDFALLTIPEGEIVTYSEFVFGKDGRRWMHVLYKDKEGYLPAKEVQGIAGEQPPAQEAAIEQGAAPSPAVTITPTPTPTPKRMSVKAGDIVTFGHYEQDNHTENGQEPIEWRVLEVKGSEALLISKYGLDAKPYNKKYLSVTWDNCTLRGWLNGDFRKAAFSSEEENAILEKTVDNGSTQGYIGYAADGGKNTEDKLFLLSYAEAWKYFGSDEERRCAPTAYAVVQGVAQSTSLQADGRGMCWWWLRSSGFYQNNAAYVNYDGSRFNSNNVNNSFYAIRPAFWVNLESEIFQSENP